MEKKEFISQLKQVLIGRGFDPKAVEAEMIPVAAYLEENKMKDVDIPVESMADEITPVLEEQKKAAANAPEFHENIEDALLASGADLGQKEEIPAEQEPKAKNPKEKLGKIGKNNPVPAKAEEKKPAADDKKEPAETEPEESAVPAAEAPAAVAETEEEDYSADAEVDNIDEFAPKKEEGDGKPGLLSRFVLWLNQLVSKKKPADAEGEDNTDPAEYEGGKNKVLFWVLFAIAIPIVVALALLVVGLYIAFWIALALLMIFLIAGLIVFVFGGALIALIGIIYGVIMIIKGETAVGLFEIGLGITVCAGVLLIGILVYNLAIRLIPYCMKLLAKLLTVALKRSKEGLASLSKTIKSI